MSPPNTDAAGIATLPAPALAARGVTKAFPGVVANDGVDFEVVSGEVHALLGENGSGKTTLCKVLTGWYQPDAGHVESGGSRIDLSSPAHAYRAGVFMVHQHFSLVERLSVAENVVLGWDRRGGALFRRRAVEADVRALAGEVGLDVDPAARIDELSVGERQKVEILKALYRGATTLILDEPTTVLTPQEAEQLFVSLRAMAADGGSVVFISHKLHEVLAVCDRVTVLRDGRTASTVDLKDGQVDAKQLARLMIGRETELSSRSDEDSAARGEVVLSVRDVVVRDKRGHDVVKGASFDLRGGEVLGLAGVAGNGQGPLVDAIAGLVKHVEGEVMLEGAPLRPGDPLEAIARGVAYVPEDRFGVGLSPGLSVTENMMLKAFRSPEYGIGPFLRSSRALSRTRELLERFSVKGSPDMRVRQLSGGNAQKVLLARELSSAPRVLVVAAPTRGLDVSAMQNVRALLLSAARSGVAVMLVSEDLDELLELTDRVAVMCGGRITGVVDSRTVEAEEVGLLMMGQETEAA